MNQSFHADLALDNRFDGIELAWVVLRNLLRGAAVSPSEEQAVELALRESLANAIRHGNGPGASEPLRLKMDFEDDQLTIRVQDSGSGFDAEQIPDPNLPENLLLGYGRGIFLMKQCMDRVEFSSPERGGTLVTMHRIIKREGVEI